MLFFLACPGFTAKALGQRNQTEFAWSFHFSLEYQSTGTFLHLGANSHKSLFYLSFLFHKLNFTKHWWHSPCLTGMCSKATGQYWVGQPLITWLLFHRPMRSSAWMGLKCNKNFLCLLCLNTYRVDPTSAYWRGINTMIKPTGSRRADGTRFSP